MVFLMKIAPQVTCDTISLIVEGETYNMDYDFGRRGVRDLGWLFVMMMTMTMKMIRLYNYNDDDDAEYKDGKVAQLQ